MIACFDRSAIAEVVRLANDEAYGTTADIAKNQRVIASIRINRRLSFGDGNSALRYLE